MATSIDSANAEAVERIVEARPVLTGLGKALDLIPGMHENLLLHAGPPIAWEQASGPLRGALIGALIFEGRARAEEEAERLIVSGEVSLAPCHHHSSVGPMAGVISPSMAVYEVENKTHGNRAFSNLNEGYGKVLRYGAYSEEVQERLRWMHEVMAPVLGSAIASSSGLDIRALLAEALHMGDEGHNRNKAGSVLYTKLLAPHKTAPDAATAADIIEALGDNALSVLNPVMAACKAMADAGSEIKQSTVVTTMARNGTEFGIRVSGLGGRWFTSPCPQPVGLYFPGFSAEDGNPDIGDSTITETAGLGATLEMYEITAAEHTAFTIPQLDFRGTPVGIDLRAVVETGITPRVNTGIAHKEAGVGQIGAGLVRPPLELFTDALVTFAEEYGF